MLAGEEFILPDMILLKPFSDDVPLPDNYPEVTDSPLWQPVLPRYRRVYPFLFNDISTVEITEPGSEPAGGDSPELDVSDFNYYSYSREVSPFNKFSAETEINLVEGMDTSLNMKLPGSAQIGGIFFFPFSSGSPRPLSGELNFERIAPLSVSANLGLKNEGAAIPYSIVHLDWNGGLSRPDSYSLDIHFYGIDNPGFSLNAQTAVDYSFKDSGWLLFGKIDGGGWYSPESFGGFVRSALAFGYGWPSSGVSLKGGADLVYSENSGFKAAPYFNVLWFPSARFSISVESGFEIGLPDAVDTVFRRENLEGYNPELPVHTNFAIALEYAAVDGIFCRVNMAYGYGLYSRALNGYVSVSEDEQISSDAGLGYKFGIHSFLLKGKLVYSLVGFPSLWDAGIEYSMKNIGFYINSGSEDAILGEDFPGIRTEQPIIGMGFNWDFLERWGLDIFAYTQIPWNNPSLRLSLNWSK